MWDTQAGAETVARAFPSMGTWIAVLDLPDDLVAVPSGAPGHWDVEGEPQRLVKAVVQVVRVR